MRRKDRHLHLVPRTPEESQDRGSSRWDSNLRSRMKRNVRILTGLSTFVILGLSCEPVQELPRKIVTSFNAEDDAPRIQVGDFCYVDGTVDGIPDDTTGECPD